MSSDATGSALFVVFPGGFNTDSQGRNPCRDGTTSRLHNRGKYSKVIALGSAKKFNIYYTNKMYYITDKNSFSSLTHKIMHKHNKSGKKLMVCMN